MKLFPIVSHRKWLLGVAFLSAIAWVIAYFMSQKIDCTQGTISCNDYINILDAFVRAPFIPSLIFTSFLFLFFSERAFKWWRWFAIVIIPILTWWIMTEDSELFGHGTASYFSGMFFLVISTLIAISSAIYNHFKLRSVTEK